MTNHVKQLTDKELLMLDDVQNSPTFIKMFTAILQRIPPEVMDVETKVVYCVCYSLQGYYKSLDKDNKLNENQILLAKQCGMTTRTLTRCLKNLYELKLMLNYTPGLRNSNHIYEVYDWTNRRDLLTEKSVYEMREEHRKTGIKYTAMNLSLFDKEQPTEEIKCDIKNELPVITTKPYLITTKWKLITTKRWLLTTKPYMNKNNIDPLKINKNYINKEVVKIITETSHKEELKEDSKSLSLPSSESVSPSSSLSACGLTACGNERIYTIKDLTADQFEAFKLWDMTSQIRQMYPNNLSKRIEYFLHAA